MSLIRTRWCQGVLGAALCGLGLVACGVPVPNERATTSSDLCMNDFQNCVMPVLTGQIRRRGGAIISCADGNCHAPGGNGGRFTLGSDIDANFLVVKNFVNFTSADSSLLLVEPTQDDVAPSPVAAFHGGGEIFLSTSDACYSAIHTWITNQVTDQMSPACGVCAPIASTLASCGYLP